MVSACSAMISLKRSRSDSIPVTTPASLHHEVADVVRLHLLDAGFDAVAWRHRDHFPGHDLGDSRALRRLVLQDHLAGVVALRDDAHQLLFSAGPATPPRAGPPSSRWPRRRWRSARSSRCCRPACGATRRLPSSLRPLPFDGALARWLRLCAHFPAIGKRPRELRSRWEFRWRERDPDGSRWEFRWRERDPDGSRWEFRWRERDPDGSRWEFRWRETPTAPGRRPTAAGPRAACGYPAW